MIRLNKRLRDFFGTHGEFKPHYFNPPLFITGCMRSGTTFLVDLLSTHPQLLKIGSELNEVWDKIGGAPIINQCTYRGKDHVDPRFTYQMTRYFSDFINHSKSFKRKLMRANYKLSSKMGRYNYDWSNIHPVNKSPHFMNKLTYINGLFPDSKWIIIIRNIYSQSTSLKIHFENTIEKDNILFYEPNDTNSCWCSKSINPDLKAHSSISYDSIPKMWIKLNKQMLKELTTIDENKYLLISYEQLVKNQARTIGRIFSFLELGSKYKNIETSIANSTIKSINTTTTGDPLLKWKKHLSQDEISIIDKVISSNQIDYDYIQKTKDFLSS